MSGTADSKRSFRHISAAGVFFQGGAAAVDTSTVIAALVHGLTGSALAVGAAAGIARFGWLFPQLFVAYYAQRRARRLPFYAVGAFGRVACLAGLAALLWLAVSPAGASVVVMFFALWTVYAFVSGIVAVPYNDIVARSIPSDRRSRMLALRFNLEGRPKGKAAPANLSADPQAEVWGVLYRITRRDLVHLDSTEGFPGRRYRHLWIEAEDIDGRPLKAVTYIADGNEVDGNPSLRYLTLLREGARAHGLPESYLRFLDSVKHAE